MPPQGRQTSRMQLPPSPLRVVVPPSQRDVPSLIQFINEMINTSYDVRRHMMMLIQNKGWDVEQWPTDSDDDLGEWEGNAGEQEHDPDTEPDEKREPDKDDAKWTAGFKRKDLA